MKAIRFHEYGGPEKLLYEDVPLPTPGPGQVLIKVEAAGVNFADIMRRHNDPYPEPTPLPFTPGVEVAGTVTALGEGVTGLTAGAAVFAAPGRGGYAEYIAVPAAVAIPLPVGLNPAQATAILLQGLTASLLLREAGRLKPGETVLVQGAAGGVGGLAVQLARHWGAGKVIAAASTEAKRHYALGLGADEAVDYTQPGWPERVKEITGGKGVDLVLEMTGGTVFHESLAALAPFGRDVIFGAASREPTLVNPQVLLAPNQTLIGFYIGPYFARPELIQSSLGELIRLTLEDKLKVEIGGSFPLKEAPEAHRRLESRETTGKIVLVP